MKKLTPELKKETLNAKLKRLTKNPNLTIATNQINGDTYTVWNIETNDFLLDYLTYSEMMCYLSGAIRQKEACLF
jgi:hypothetical protein